MSRRTTGTILLFISALLYSTRYVSAAIFGSSLAGGWSADLFAAMLQYVGNSPVTWSVATLITGLVYLVWAEVEVFLRSGADR